MIRYLIILTALNSMAWCCDSTKADISHIYELSHHINTRSNWESDHFDWFGNVEGKYEYTKGINPEVKLYVSSERDSDTIFNAHLIRLQSDYFFIEDNVDEEHNINIFSVGLHYRWNVLKVGYAATIDRVLYHGVYAELDYEYLDVDLLYTEKLYRYRIAPKLKVNFGYNDIFYFELKTHYTKELNIRPFWEAGTKIGFEINI